MGHIIYSVMLSYQVLLSLFSSTKCFVVKGNPGNTEEKDNCILLFLKFNVVSYCHISLAFTHEPRNYH